MNWHDLWALGLLPAALAAFALILLQRQRAKTAALLLNAPVPGRLWIRPAAVGAAVLLVVVALARPQVERGEETVAAQGRDVIFVVDVSRSMMAPDLFPNRLERAKLGLSDVLGALEGDRVALVAFAGTAVLKVPLTRDYGFFRSAVNQLSPLSAARGGSLIGDALRLVQGSLLGDRPSGTTVFLITDGDDQESFPLQAARRLGESGGRLIVLGLGSPGGSDIPLPEGGFLEYKGERVRSDLNVELLKSLADATPGGVFLNAGTSPFDLASLYRELRSPSANSQGPQRLKIYEEYAFWAILAAFLIFLAEGMFSGFDRRMVK